MACTLNTYIQYEEESFDCGYYSRTDGNWLPSNTGEWFHDCNTLNMEELQAPLSLGIILVPYPITIAIRSILTLTLA